MYSKILKLVDVDVNGCGEDIIELLNISSKKPFEITREFAQRIKDVITNEKEENEENEYWDTEDIISAVKRYLISNGFSVESIYADEVIEF